MRIRSFFAFYSVQLAAETLAFFAISRRDGSSFVAVFSHLVSEQT